jgi:hypothetical protein
VEYRFAYTRGHKQIDLVNNNSGASGWDDDDARQLRWTLASVIFLVIMLILCVRSSNLMGVASSGSTFLLSALISRIPFGFLDAFRQSWYCC